MIDVRRADMHTHTRCSDGRLAPAELVARAHACGLHALAVTDHDGIDGIAEAREAGRRHGVEVVPGVELSVAVGDVEVHLLGYFFDPDNAGLRAYLAAYRAARRDRATQIVERLHALGVPLAWERVAEQAGDAVVGRPHVAWALAADGHVASYSDAFDRYLGNQGPANVPKTLAPAGDALALLHEAGGIGVLAHPGHWTTDSTLMVLIRAGLDGIEIVHPSHDETVTRYYRQIARDFGLLETGGSDYHGGRPADDDNLGRYTVPYPRLDRARRAAHALRVT